MHDPSRLDLDPALRGELWRRLAETVERYAAGVDALPVAPVLDAEALRAQLAPFDFESPLAPEAALDFAARGLTHHQVHTPHPRYFGLFNPAPSAMGIAADALVAAFNPQMAAWSHNPFAAEVEAHLCRTLGARFGWPAAQVDGVFCSGGAEANHTGLLAALNTSFPEFAQGGARALPAQPVFYVSEEAHHSFAKAARLCGLGAPACRAVPADVRLRMDLGALEDQLRRDRSEGLLPFLLVATAGTTSAGAIDPLPELGALARREELWLHVDAAWGGAAALIPELRGLLAGLEQADSLTFDAHKWLSVPMGAGLFLTRHPAVLTRTFATRADYMPRDAAGLEVTDPFMHSMQWSRRFIGLKLFLTLAVAGWGGYAAALGRMARAGAHLRQRLAGRGWPLVNDTPLPIACFVDGRSPQGRSAEHLQAVAQRVVGSGRAWVSTVLLRGEQPALRACVTNYRTSEADVDGLVAALDQARSG